jgi:hypothetical protein
VIYPVRDYSLYHPEQVLVPGDVAGGKMQASPDPPEIIQTLASQASSENLISSSDQQLG